MTVRVGVIGVGVMGAEHARLLSSTIAGSAVSAVYDVDEPRSRSVAATYSACSFDDPTMLIEDESVDAVLIASSDATHEGLVLACLAVGKPVLCEKPLAPTIEACRRILASEIDGGRRLVGVGFMRRFDPGFQTMRADLRAGAIGTPLLMHCVHRNAELVGVTSPLLITGSAVHEIDVARWLLDDEPVSITVHRPRRSSRAGGAQDPVILIVEMSTGLLVDVEVFVNAGYGYEVRAELVGETGTASVDTPAGNVRRSAGAVTHRVDDDWRERFAQAYRSELQDWVDAVAAQRASGAATAWDGYVATATAQAGVAALETGERTQILLEEKPELYA